MLPYFKKAGITQVFVLFMLVFTPFSITITANVSVNTDQKLDQTKILNILTRHETAIQDSFKEGFLASTYSDGLGLTKENIVFWEIGTTQGWIKALERSNSENAMDLAWGGGPPLFDSMAQAGYFLPVDDVSTATVTLVNDVVADEIAGVEMKRVENNKLIWVSNVISSFGFTVNRRILEQYGLEMPSTWEDLASPDFFVDEEVQTISMGNPPDTTSNTRIYQIILQKFGWDKGWEILTSMAGNGGIFGGSLGTRAAVVDAQVAVGMTIDFYGVFTQNECAEADRCEYVIPEGGSAINGDPIAFTKNTQNQEAGIAFYEYVFSDEGQSLWIKNDRLPINPDAFNTTLGKTRPDVRDLYEKTLVNQGIDFDDDLALNTLESTKEYFESSITDVHDELKAAWAKIVTDYKDGITTLAEFEAEVTNLAKPQITLQEALTINEQIKSDASYRFDTKATWQATAGDRYNEISGIKSDIEDSPVPMLWIIFSIFSMMMVTPILRKKRT